jgi:hypothetical protein
LTMYFSLESPSILRLQASQVCSWLPVPYLEAWLCSKVPRLYLHPALSISSLMSHRHVKSTWTSFCSPQPFLFHILNKFPCHSASSLSRYFKSSILKSFSLFSQASEFPQPSLSSVLSLPKLESRPSSSPFELPRGSPTASSTLHTTAT